MEKKLHEFSRTELLFQDEEINNIKNARVIVFGLGGVGSYVVEALTRAGVGSIDIVDHDVVSLTNINRQLYALHSTIGIKKIDVARNRILDINPNCKVKTYDCFYGEETKEIFDFANYDYVIDAIDTVTAKLLLITEAKAKGTRVISSMGTGNKLNPLLFEIADISKTYACPLAKVMRSELKKRGIKKVKVLFSSEKSIKPREGSELKGTVNRPAPGSVSFVPSVAGLLIASEVIKDISLQN